ncbi:hypothetical protein [Spiroplasma ixodetis]|uniref:Transposase n=1 Tax=Spiroplasma ixodetis TaxID=2141 RepID=A0ABM8BTE1_9MOLU|nr:hypothetical protein [Spiroplasma ixodetis]BDT03118.1 hypothetical protein SHM_07640 [Spiroplasma ixodetis]
MNSFSFIIPSTSTCGEKSVSYLPLRTYKNKLTNEIITPTRTYIDIDKYKNYTNWVNKLIIINADLNNITYPIIKHNLKINISLSTICRRLKETIIFVQELPKEKRQILPTDYIYIQSDESYNNLRLFSLYVLFLNLIT